MTRGRGLLSMLSRIAAQPASSVRAHTNAPTHQTRTFPLGLAVLLDHLSHLQCYLCWKPRTWGACKRQVPWRRGREEGAWYLRAPSVLGRSRAVWATLALSGGGNLLILCVFRVSVTLLKLSTRGQSADDLGVCFVPVGSRRETRRLPSYLRYLAAGEGSVCSFLSYTDV